MLVGAFQAMDGLQITDDAIGVFRRVDFWAEDQVIELCMEDEGGSPKFDVPKFEKAWKLVVGLFPDVPALSWQVVPAC